MPTLRQERLAEALADPGIKTKKDALLAAGYSPTSARHHTANIVAGSGTERAKGVLERRRLDSARSLKALGDAALEQLHDRVQEGATDQTLLGVVKVTYDARAAGVDDDAETLTPQDRSAARAMVLRYCRIAARVAVYRALRGASVADAPELPGQPPYLSPLKDAP